MEALSALTGFFFGETPFKHWTSEAKTCADRIGRHSTPTAVALLRNQKVNGLEVSALAFYVGKERSTKVLRCCEYIAVT